LAQALGALGIREDDRVGTMAWNGHRHMELFFDVGFAPLVATLAAKLTGVRHFIAHSTRYS
jgi:acyl-CoA synthetase (AMP-forming)/AMP-acid ligase II